MSTVTIKPRSPSIKGFSEELVSFSVQRLADKVASKSKLPANRVRFSIKEDDGKYKPVKVEGTLNEYFDAQALSGDVVLYAKDVGPQVDYRTVFLVEYLGPIPIHLVAYYVSTQFFGVAHSATQQVALWLVLLHFVKRELETLYVHRFSNSTMPLFNLLKNSSHYWLQSGFALAICLYSFDPASLQSAGALKQFLFHVNGFPAAVNVLIVGVWAFAEVSNFLAHKKLSDIRATDKKKYAIPYGYGFDLVACPNYTFESLTWLSFAVLVGNWSAWVFFAVSTVQMYIWAVARHKKYLKTFGDEYKKLRRAKFVPFLL